jgi:hypothetical protein
VQKLGAQGRHPSNGTTAGNRTIWYRARTRPADRVVQGPRWQHPVRAGTGLKLEGASRLTSKRPGFRVSGGPPVGCHRCPAPGAGPIESARTVCCSGSAATELCSITSGSSRSGGQVLATRRTRTQHVQATPDATVVSYPAVRQGSDAGCLTLVQHRTIRGHVAPRELVCS